MRFTLAYISAALLASLALAAPATVHKREADDGAAAAAAPPAQVENIALEIGDKFQPFHWDTADDVKTVDRKFTFTLTEPAQLQITDYKLGGDSFEVMDNGVALGSTSNASSDEGLFANTPEDALQDERFSHGTFELAAGDHEITVKVANSPYPDGTGALRIVQKVQALYKGDDDDDDDYHDKKKKDDDDEDCEDEEEYKKDEGEWKKKGKKTIYVYYTVSSSAPAPTLRTETISVPTASVMQGVVATETV
ncbi:hypothetical protein BX666DRAFT_1537447 [Dichotomocladium elegans]|nr:hypothetical protein BX666DRAFT_1537447 [Dichotomocladium elegans]